MGKASFRIHGTTLDHPNTELERHPEVLGISGLYFGLIIKKNCTSSQQLPVHLNIAIDRLPHLLEL